MREFTEALGTPSVILKQGFRDGVTVILTSCKRYDLLIRTIKSFIAQNTFEIHEFILVEDGPTVPSIFDGYQFPFKFRMICTGERVGAIAAIDYGYSHVQTEFVFHLEDDWEFYRPHFIEKSLSILSDQDNCLQVWLRAHNDTNGHPIKNKIFNTGSISWQKMAYGYEKKWYGFSFNPGLRRIKDYIDIGGYGIHSIGLPSRASANASMEPAIGRVYRQKRMFAAILSDEKGMGYVRHLGWNRTVVDKPIDRKR